MTDTDDRAPIHVRRRLSRVGGLGAVAVVVVLTAANPAAAATTPSARDRALLAAGVIQQSDVPSGWVARKQGAETATRFKGIAACKQLAPIVNAALLTVSHRLSSGFSDPTSGTQTTMVENTAFAFKDAAGAARYLGAYRATSVPTCFTKSVERTVRSSLQGASATISVAPLTSLAGLGDDEVGYGVILTVSAQGQQQSLFDDIVAVRVGRAVLGFNFQNLGAELPMGPAIIRQTSSRVAPLAT